MKPAHWPLDRVKTLAAEGKLIVLRTRALEFFPTLREALEEVKCAVLQLDEKQFACSVKLTHDIADVYGVKRGCEGWYLKLTIDDEGPEVVVISFHPLERPLRTRGGVLTP